MINERSNRVYLPTGYILYGKYRIVRVIGAGGFGVTYEVYDMHTGKPYALKELFPLKFARRSSNKVTVEPTDEDFYLCLDKFKKEAEMLMRLSADDDILKIYHLFNFNNTIYYVMELLKGEDLQKRLSRGRLTWSEAEKLFSSLMASLEKLHRLDVIHRDITPDNIFLLEDGSVKLIDFGSVRSIYNTKFTTALKEKFAPIEQFSNDSKQGAYTDIYSLCVTIYYSLTGVVPPKSVERFTKDEIVNVSQYCPSLPEHVAKAIMKGLNVQIKDRYSSVKELSDDMFIKEKQSATGPEQKVTRHAFSEIIGIAKKHIFSETKTVVLSCEKGFFAGKKFILKPGVEYSVGRNSNCRLVFPINTTGVSRLQCVFSFDGKNLFLSDYSSYGTYVDGFLIGKEKSVRILSGATINFAGEIFRISY